MGSLSIVFVLCLLQILIFQGKLHQETRIGISKNCCEASNCPTLCHRRCRESTCREKFQIRCCQKNEISKQIWKNITPKNRRVFSNTTNRIPKNSKNRNEITVNFTTNFLNKQYLPIHSNFSNSRFLQLPEVTQTNPHFGPENQEPRSFSPPPECRYNTRKHRRGKFMKKEYATRLYCFWPGYCKYFVLDCSRCNYDYYMEYSSFMQCHPCFYIDYSDITVNNNTVVKPN